MSHETLFPVPLLPKSPLSPSRWPGISPQSTDALREILMHNHVSWHIFFNEKRFHNHASHRAIAAWHLGASPQVMKANYEKDCGTEKPAYESPNLITADNVYNHLGDERFYNAYLKYFTSYVNEKGISTALEEFLFSWKANHNSEKEPLMLNRFLSGVLHPLIHTGYGAEFSIPGMIIEGLAQTAVHQCPHDLLRHLSLFDDATLGGRRIIPSVVSSDLSGAFNSAVAAFDHAVEKVVPKAARESVDQFVPPSKPAAVKFLVLGVNPQHALSILSRVLQNRYPPPPKSQQQNATTLFEKVSNDHGKDIGDLVSQWGVNETNINEKIEEIAWTVCVMYAVGGWTDAKLKNQDFNADFFFMHFVTSSIFLPALCGTLSPSSQVRLLKAYFSVALVWVIARGQPPLDIKGFMTDTSVDALLLSSEESKGEERDPWMTMINSARNHNDEHVTKVVRALAGWSAAFGVRKARAAVKGDGHVGESMPEVMLEGAEYLDGGLFMRAGLLTMEKMGWDPAGKQRQAGDEDGGETEFWDMHGFFSEEMISHL